MLTFILGYIAGIVTVAVIAALVTAGSDDDDQH